MPENEAAGTPQAEVSAEATINATAETTDETTNEAETTEIDVQAILGVELSKATAQAQPPKTKNAVFGDFLAPYHLPDPYPIPVGLPTDKRKGRILLKAYAGKHSELSALTQYVVHHESCTEKESDASRTLICIAMVEMHHLDMLGGLIHELGVGAALKSGFPFPLPWSSKHNQIGADTEDSIALDIAGEKACIQGYNTIIAKLNDPRINALLRRIIQDEELHIEILRKLQHE